jgi:predicted AAA+ superfamily ATPase
MELGSEGLVARFVIWRNGFRNCCRAGWSLAGQVLENFVIGEIGRQRTWAELSVQMFHYRDREQREVDLVLEANDGRVVGIDVKSSTTARAEDFRHLEHLRRLAGKKLPPRLRAVHRPERAPVRRPPLGDPDQQPVDPPARHGLREQL